jgi:glycosyltransferase involved in cell wall biosynthesis
MNCIKFDILIPTFQRRDKLLRCLNAIYNNTYKRWNISIQYDVDNKFAFNYWNEQCLRGTGDWVICLSDDTELHPDCLEKIIEIANEKYPDTDGFIGINQENIQDGHGASKSAQPCMGRKFLERFGNRGPFCHDYIGFFADTEIGDFARSINKFTWGESAKLTHYHPGHFISEIDFAHHNLRQNDRIGFDKEMYKRRRELGYLWGRDFNLCGR